MISTILKSLMFALSMLIVVNTAFGQLSGIENRFITDVFPLKAEVKNYETANWINEIEIIITNTGEKPIYYLHFMLMFEKARQGSDIGFPFQYGDLKKLRSNAGKPEPNMVPISPGQSHTFKVRPDIIEGWEKAKVEGEIKEPTSAYLDITFLDFADGTNIRRVRPAMKPQ